MISIYNPLPKEIDTINSENEDSYQRSLKILRKAFDNDDRFYRLILERLIEIIVIDNFNIYYLV